MFPSPFKGSISAMTIGGWSFFGSFLWTNLIEGVGGNSACLITVG